MQRNSLDCTYPVADLKLITESVGPLESADDLSVKPSQAITGASIALPSALSSRDLH